MRPADTTSRAELEAALLRRLRGNPPTIPRLPRPAGPARFPASPAQVEACTRAWRDPAQPDRVVLNGLRLRGPLDVPALERALAAVVQRHETLRIAFEQTEDGLVQVITPVVDVPVTVVEGTEDDFAAQTLAALEPAMDLRTGPLIRFRLLRLAADDHIAIVVLHHVIADARATEVLLADLAEAYLGVELAPLPIQYVDFVMWQRERLAGPAAAKVGYWLTRLAGAPAVPIPADFPPFDGPAHRGDLLAVPLPDDLFARLRAFARANDATIFVTTLAAFQVLLARLGGTRDVAVAVPVAFRDRAELEGLIADFSQAMVSRIDLAGDPSFETVVATARDRFAEDLDQADVPRDLVVRKLPGHVAELFDRLEFGVDRDTATDGPGIGLDLEPLPPLWPYAERPLTVRLSHDDEHALLYVTYRCRDFSRARVADLAEDYVTVLAGCLDRPAASPFGPGAPALRIGCP